MATFCTEFEADDVISSTEEESEKTEMTVTKGAEETGLTRNTVGLEGRGVR